jgi:secreted Zn-dependent insulinase-like peptidase
MGQTEKMLYLYLLVQSGAYPADLLLERTEAFIPQFVSEFNRLPPEGFEKYRAAVVQAKLQRDRAPAETARRLFYTAFRNEENWDYLSEEIRAVEALRQPDVQAVLQRTLSGGGRRRLVIRLIGKGHPAKPPRGQAITLPSTLPAAG